MPAPTKFGVAAKESVIHGVALSVVALVMDRMADIVRRGRACLFAMP